MASTIILCILCFEQYYFAMFNAYKYHVIICFNVKVLINCLVNSRQEILYINFPIILSFFSKAQNKYILYISTYYPFFWCTCKTNQSIIQLYKLPITLMPYEHDEQPNNMQFYCRSLEARQTRNHMYIGCVLYYTNHIKYSWL